MPRRFRDFDEAVDLWRGRLRVEGVRLLVPVAVNGGFLLRPMYREVSAALAYLNGADWFHAKKASSLKGALLDNPGSSIRK